MFNFTRLTTPAYHLNTTPLPNIRRFSACLLMLLSTIGPHAVQANLPAVMDGQPLPSLAPMLENVTPAVVNISTKTYPNPSQLWLEEFYGIQRERRSMNAPHSLGSGVIVDSGKGLVLTNNHVISDADEVLVTLVDGRELVAEVLGTDPKADLALLQIESNDLMAVKWADSDQLRVGDFVVAIGNPFGLGQTVTSGIVSALERSGLGIEDVEDFIQTDASINPGNSGGALVNLRGELIGINTAIVGPSGGNVGIGFAIPANMAHDIADQLLEHGEVRRGMLGIAVAPLTPELMRQLGYSNPRDGIVIARVETDSPAEQSGLQVGDLIMEVDGKSVKTVGSVINRLGLARVGEQLKLKIQRGDDILDITSAVVLLDQLSPLLAGTVFEDAISRRGRSYVVIESVKPGSRLDKAGLQAGDIILSVNKMAVGTVAEMKTLLEPDAGRIVLYVQRGQATRYVDISDD